MNPWILNSDRCSSQRFRFSRLLIRGASCQETVCGPREAQGLNLFSHFPSKIDFLINSGLKSPILKFQTTNVWLCQPSSQLWMKSQPMNMFHQNPIAHSSSSSENKRSFKLPVHRAQPTPQSIKTQPQKLSRPVRAGTLPNIQVSLDPTRRLWTSQALAF